MTTINSSKIGSTNVPLTMDYTSILAWAAACPANLVTADEIYEAVFYDQGEINLTDIIVMSVNTDTTRYISWRTATAAETGSKGASFRDHPDAATNPLRYNPAVGVAIELTVGYGYGFISGPYADFHLSDLQLQTTRGTTSSGARMGSLVMDSCIISGGGFYSNDQRANDVFSNCLFMDNGSVGFFCVTNGVIKNCTLIGNGTTTQGIADTYSSGNTVYNTAIFGISTPINANTAKFTGSNNATDQASFGSGFSTGLGLTNVAFDNTTFVSTTDSVDYRTPSGSVLQNAGSTANGTATDILGTSRPVGSASDIGVYEATASSYSDGSTETLMGQETTNATTFLTSLTTETSTATDHLTAIRLISSQISETGTLDDVANDAASFLTTILESGTATDQPIGQVTTYDNVTESSGATDHIENITEVISSLGETGDVTDSANGLLYANATIMETGSLTTQTIASIKTTVVETGSVSDSVYAVIDGNASGSAAGSSTVTASSLTIGRLLYPYAVFAPGVAAQEPQLLPAGTLALIPLDLSVVQMMKLVLAQASFTEDYGMHAWISRYPAGSSLLTALDVFPLMRMAPRPVVLYVPGQTPPDATYLAPVEPGAYYLNVLNLTNSLSRFSFAQTNLA